MTSSRDNFSKKTKSVLALRASYECSLCKVSTVGPSDEASNAVTMIGVAAHIAAAAPGPGARRYDHSMTPEQRGSIDNGIWLCASCSVLIDRDEARFSTQNLHELKLSHEASRRLQGQGEVSRDDIIAIGPSLIALGAVLRFGPDGYRFRISHFLEGNIRELWAMSVDFSKWPDEDRYVLSNELGYGGLLSQPPAIERTELGYEVTVQIQVATDRRNAMTTKTMCTETGRMLGGVDAMESVFGNVLGMAHGTWFTDLQSGSFISDYHERYVGSDWLSRLIMMDIIRLSFVPRNSRAANKKVAPLAWVNRVNSVSTPTFELTEQYLSIHVDAELEGVGNWSGVLPVFICTPEQLQEGRDQARRNALLISPTVDHGLVEALPVDKKTADRFKLLGR
ncbi:hypothetical protein SFA35_04065 [Pseudomonas sp. HR96]|uniref:hypothetical protein n=1 Tax=Pseudomonas sp. HR96 TaxID=1027966 RepID=UPI002A74E60E|nr:hypothetical protein [Pseudomonas sp. HR96]WPP00566.1 hypothetical protein SFA35_04065 [Pseudomonas sp. HR96]